MSLFHNHTAKVSMMRVGFFACLVVGAILSIGGLFAAFNSLPDASALVTTGSTLMGASGFAKAIQSRWEKPND